MRKHYSTKSRAITMANIYDPAQLRRTLQETRRRYNILCTNMRLFNSRTALNLRLILYNDIVTIRMALKFLGETS